MEAIQHAEARKAASLMVLEHQEQVAELGRSMKQIELAVTDEVAGETDEAGKAKHSNADKRAAEVAKRLQADEKYTHCLTVSEHSRHTAAVQQIEAQYHADMIRILCASAHDSSGAA
jgi:hypothetical protein